MIMNENNAVNFACHHTSTGYNLAKMMENMVSELGRLFEVGSHFTFHFGIHLTPPFATYKTTHQLVSSSFPQLVLLSQLV